MIAKLKLGPRDLLWIAYGAVLLIYGAHRGPVTSDEALYWIIRRSYSFALFHLPLDALLHGVTAAKTTLLQSLQGAGDISFYGKPFLFFMTIPLSIFSLGYVTLILPTVIGMTAFFAWGVRLLRGPLALALWTLLFIAPPLMWLFGPSATGNALAGCLLVFAIIAVSSPRLGPKWRWSLFGLLLALSATSHYSIIPAAAAICIVTLFVKRGAIDLRTFGYFLCGALVPLALTEVVTFALQIVFTHLFGAGVFLNYAQDLLNQFGGVQSSGGGGLDIWYYPHVLGQTGGFEFFLLIFAVLAFVAWPRYVRDLRFHAGWIVFVVGLVAMSAQPTVGARTLLDILPAAYLSTLVLLEYASESLPGRTKNFRVAMIALLALFSLLLVLATFSRLLDVLRYRDLGDDLQQVIEIEHPEYGQNPYVEGYNFHFFRYAFLARATLQELYPGWRQDASIWTYEFDPAQESGPAFVAACASVHHGVIEVMNWDAFSKYNWVDNATFGETVSSPFAVCFAPPQGQ